VSRLAGQAPGFSRTFCALIAEDRGPVRSADTGDGLGRLLDAVTGRPGPDPGGDRPGEQRWNRQFDLFTRAVLAGRAGRTGAAQGALDQAEQAAAPYPHALHLCLRLVAEAAHRDGWGDPVTWLRRAEEYFHDASVPAVAGACRALLRRIGATAPQRRSGADLVPRALRMLGVTAREYEVLLLLVNWPSNHAIGKRLHISPRTVEKHVASLIVKTNQPNRAALGAFAADFDGEQAYSA
jgi:DNA-binding CsgD family transcriptional regulator